MVLTHKPLQTLFWQATFAPPDAPRSRVRGSDNGAQKVPYASTRLGVGVGVCSYQGCGWGARATPTGPCADHVDAG